MSAPENHDGLWNARDYREFLRQWFEAQKVRRPSISLTSLGRKLALDPSLLGRIFQSDRHLATSRIQPVCDLVGLTGVRAEYFRHLVLHAKSKTAREAQVLFERMQELRRIAPVPLEDSQESYWDHWMNVALRSLLSCGNFGDDWETMGDLLHPRQTARAVQVAMGTLKRMGMVAKDADGFWRLVEPFVKDRPGGNKHALRNYHRQSILHALDALDGMDPTHRSITCSTFTIDSRENAELMAMIDDFRSRLLTRASKVAQPDRVVQLTVQLVPVAGRGFRPSAEKD